ncbi:DEAD/DEAH box helicase [Miltoncostaea marina]|uniref:DEAD/DEAH box helicase n=1 Tax=Miltoncostaea marina TaxID=2843215 RepID=UPI001C3E3E36|nr:DEAD/DEAH box helicase family protein [Miltoncostaea marina]
MARSIRLRRWQKAALDAFRARSGPDFLAVATPGAGKTTFALAAARQDLAEHPRRRLVVVAPTQHLKTQWADAAERLDLHLEPGWTPADGRLPADVHGMVTTYQQVAGSAAALAPIAAGAFVVLDESHHSGEERAWGDGVRAAFAGAAVRLSLSGTPFRSDTRAIPFVRYDDEGLAQADVEYGYGDALEDGGVVRPVHFPRTDGHMEWIAADGTQASATFADRLDPVGAAQRLRTALSVEGEWLPDVLRRAHERLLEVRRTHPGAGGMVIAIDQEHARGIAALLRRRVGVEATVVVSEDPAASARIGAFAQGTDPWIVAVRMISEGVDIPRLRVGVYATTTTTELFFRQAVGRLVRWTRGLGAQPSHMFIPDDPRLRAHAAAIAEQRRHSLRRDDGEGAPPEDAEEPPEEPAGDPDDQLSLFAPISAVATTGAAEPLVPVAPAPAAAERDDDGLLLELAPAPLLVAPAPPGSEEERALSPRERRRRLRDANAALVRHISRITGLSHAQVNAELNRRVGLERVGEATLEQLERRREHAARWLAAA